MNRRNKTITIVALIVAIASLTIGFAAFSSKLTISSGVTVTPNSDTFKVKFIGDIECTPGEKASVKSVGTLTDDSVSGIVVELREPGASVTCNATVKNVGEYTAYLNTVTVPTPITCSQTEDSTASDNLVQDACKSMEMDAMIITPNYQNLISVNSKEIISSKFTDAELVKLEKNEESNIKFDIIYSTLNLETHENASRADGAFIINIPTVNLKYSSVFNK